jgi:ribonuclease VapC
MVLDTSALLAILFDEPERDAFTRLIENDPVRLLSAANRVEVTLVVEGRKREPGRADLERLLAEANVEIVALSPDQAEIACDAFRRYGRARHPAGLNLGDVFAYALAKDSGEPQLFKGGDFANTDIPSAA